MRYAKVSHMKPLPPYVGINERMKNKRYITYFFIFLLVIFSRFACSPSPANACTHSDNTGTRPCTREEETRFGSGPWTSNTYIKSWKCYGACDEKTLAKFGMKMVVRSIPKERAVRAILGESRGEGSEGRYAMACMIHNRGTLKGVNGLSKIHKVNGEYVADLGPDKPREVIPDIVVENARYAWERSVRGVDTTNGGTHCLSDYDRKHTTTWRQWIDGYVKTARVRHTIFYKLRAK